MKSSEKAMYFSVNVKTSDGSLRRMNLGEMTKLFTNIVDDYRDYEFVRSEFNESEGSMLILFRKQ